MKQDYTISAGIKIFYGLLSVSLFGLSVFCLAVYSRGVSALILLPALFCIVGSLLISINIIKRRVITYPDRIVSTGSFSTKELSIAAAKGYRKTKENIYIESSVPGTSSIRIGHYSDLSNSQELAQWVQSNFKDLDAIDLKNSYNEVLQDVSLGYTETERMSKLKKLKELAWAYNIWSMLLGFIMLLFDNIFSSLALLIAPLIAIPIMATSHGITKFVSDSKRSTYNYVVIGFMAPSIMLLIKSLGNYNMLQLKPLWLTAAVISLLVFGLLYLYGINKSIPGAIGQAVFMFILALVYGFGSVRQVNCFFDHSAPQNYSAKVLGHHTVKGKSTTYYLTISPWGPQHIVSDIEIHSSLYSKTFIGDTIKLSYKQGLLHIPWFMVAKD